MDQKKLNEFNKLTESFINEVEKMNLNEGWWDTAKASAAGTKGSFQGLGQQIKGGFNKAVGNVANKGINYLSKGLGGDPSKSPWAKSAQNLAKQGQSQIDTGKKMGYNAKYDTYIESSIDTLVNDLEKLNIPIANKNKLMADVKKSIQTNTQGSTTSKPSQQSGGITKPAAAPTPATSKPAPSSIASKPSQQSGGIAKPTSAPKPSAGISRSVAPSTSGQKVATAPQKSMAVPPSSTNKLSGYKAIPKSLMNPPEGYELSANGRQFIEKGSNPVRPVAQQPAQQTKPVPQEPAKQPKSNQAQKEKAREKVKQQMQGQINKAA
jgi:hypothetical protein